MEHHHHGQRYILADYERRDGITGSSGRRNKNKRIHDKGKVIPALL
jgi:hypothetical protein